MEIIPFKAEHLQAMRLQPAQAEISAWCAGAYPRALEASGGGWTAMADGEPVACAGIVEQWQGRGLAWAVLAEHSGRHFVRITRAVRRALDLAHYRRIEAQVDAEFVAAIRWATMLGFEVESKMTQFTPEGRDAFMFVRIR